MNTPSDESTM